jgi:hypothetical protein
MSWTNNVQETIQSAFEQIVGISDWGKSMDLPPAVIEGMVQPYKQMIADAYREDIPLATVLDQADLVIGVAGGQIEHGKAPVGVMAELFKEAKTNIGKLVNAIAGSPKAGIQPALTFYQFAPGSVYLGFKIQEPNGALLNSESVETTREALKVLGLVTRLLDARAPQHSFGEVYPDQTVVDTALEVVREFAPSQKSMYQRVTLGGTSLSLEERENSAPIVVLTSEYRERVKVALVRSKETKPKATKAAVKQVNGAEVTLQVEGNPKGFLDSLQPNDRVALRKLETETTDTQEDQDGLFSS